MKKKLVFLLLLFSLVFSIKNVYADVCKFPANFYEAQGMTVTEVYPANPEKAVHLKDRVGIYIRIKGNFDSSATFTLHFVPVTEGETVSASGIINNSSFVTSSEGATNADGTLYYTNFVVSDYYGFKEGIEYKYNDLFVEANDLSTGVPYTSPSGKELMSYQMNCASFAFDKNALDATYYENTTLLKNNVGSTLKISLKDENLTPPPTVKINSITIDKPDVYIGGTMNFRFSFTEPVKNIDLGFKGPDGKMLSVSMFGKYTENQFTAMGYAPTARAASNYKEGKYELYQLSFYDKNGNFISYSKGYTTSSLVNEYYKSYAFPLTLNLIFNLKKSDNLVENLNDVFLENFQLNVKTSSIGSSVPVVLKASSGNRYEIQSAHINFLDKNTKAMFSSYFKSLDSDPYFVIPSIAKEGTYNIDSIVFTLKSTDPDVEQTGANTVVIKDTVENERYKDIFAQVLTVTKENNKNVLYYSTEDLNDVVYHTVKNSQENSIIVVDAEQESIIPSDLFDTIKGTSRQLIINYKGSEWIVNGVDIISSKSIDVSMNFYETKDSTIPSTLKGVLDNESYVIEFVENGELPGAILIRVKAEELFGKLTNDKYYIYYVDEDNNKLDKVAAELQKSDDGYLEFYINHNSKYVITNKEIKNNDALGDTEDILNNNNILVPVKNTTEEETPKKEVNNNLLYIIIGGAAVVILVLIIIIVNMSKKKKDTLDDKPVISEPLEEDTSEEEKKEE